MENEASKTRSLNIAFLVDAQDLRGLEALLKEFKGSLDYKVKFSDGSTVRYEDVEDVVSQTRQIVSVIASAEGHGRQSTFLTMRIEPQPSVEYTVNGPQRNVIYFAEKLDDWIASTRQWYSAFYSTNLNFIPAISAFILPFLATAWVGKALPWKVGATSPLPLVVLIAVAVAEYWMFKMFPRGTFAIGFGIRKERWRAALRVSLAGAFVVSFIAGVFANFVTRH